MLITRTTLRKYPSLLRKIDIFAESKKMNFQDAVVFLLKGVNTSIFSDKVYTPSKGGK